MANRVGDPDGAIPVWVRTEWEDVYWDDAYPASALLDQSFEASMAYNLLEVDEIEGKLQQSTLPDKILDIMVEGRLQFIIEDRLCLTREQGY